MKVAILRVGEIEQNVLRYIKEGIPRVFAHIECVILEEMMPLPLEAYDDKRGQYNSSFLLDVVREYLKKTDADKILGITDADIFVPKLNFVFGEAELQGEAAIISLCRLEPEFYDYSADRSLFLERAIKETVHEIGHTFGLTHCSNNLCVMAFSNAIGDVDRKKWEFCKKCSKQLSKLIPCQRH